MGGSGGGESTSGTVDTPEVAALKQRATQEIGSMLDLNPLSRFAGWQPREIAGTNPYYQQAFGMQTPASMALFGDQTAGYPVTGGGVPTMQAGQAGTNMAAMTMPFTGGSGGTIPAPPGGYTPSSIQDVVNQQVAAAVNPAVQQAVNQAAPPRDTYQNGVYWDQYGIPHNPQNPGDSLFGAHGGDTWFVSGNNVYRPDGTMVS